MRKLLDVMKPFSPNDENGIVFTNGEYVLRAKADGKSDAIAMKQIVLDEDSEPVSFSHFRFDEEIDTLVSVSEPTNLG
ncbi:MAG TPA: hypothetical protein G4N95_08905 [Anaerolineae bacterium]|nr:hypothetical protein [Anaerolineae bacterium]